MKFFKSLKIVAAMAAPAVAAVVQPDSLVNLAVGALAKHVVPNKVLPNDLIPYLNVGVSSAVCIAHHALQTGDWGAAVLPGISQGLTLAGTSNLVHQAVKIPVRSMAPNTKVLRSL